MIWHWLVSMISSRQSESIGATICFYILGWLPNSATMALMSIDTIDIVIKIVQLVSLLTGLFLSIVLLHINLPKWREQRKKK